MNEKFKNATIENAYKVLVGEELSPNEALDLIKIEESFRMDLYSLANKVKHLFSNRISTCEITNAKSGACSEDCAFCAQSSKHNTNAPVYALRDEESLLESAKIAKEHGAHAFCIVVSGKGYLKPNNEFKKIIESAKKIIQETGIELHCSIGILSEETASMLKNTGVAMINHNIETAPSYFKKICTTHSVEDRIATVKVAKKAGLKVCCGGILGLGETLEQRIEFAFALKELDVDAIPVNVHQKITGTVLNETPISPFEVLNAIAVLRLVNPSKRINVAAGRNTILADYQAFLFHAGANGMLIGNYLTISGRKIEDDKRLLSQLGS